MIVDCTQKPVLMADYSLPNQNCLGTLNSLKWNTPYYLRMHVWLYATLVTCALDTRRLTYVKVMNDWCRSVMPMPVRASQHCWLINVTPYTEWFNFFVFVTLSALYRVYGIAMRDKPTPQLVKVSLLFCFVFFGKILRLVHNIRVSRQKRFLRKYVKVS